MKGYRLYDTASKQIFVFRDVLFHEGIFPFYSVVSSDELIDPFPDLVLPIPWLEKSPIPQFLPSNHHSTHNDIPAASHNDNFETSDAEPQHSNSFLDKTALRRSTRTSKPPSYLREFHCNLLHQKYSNNETPPCTSAHPISKYLSYNSSSHTHINFVLNVSSQFEPWHYRQAVKFPQWRVAVTAELDAMGSNKTWSDTSLPSGKHSIGCRWIYKIKYKSNGTIERYKARLVAKGHTQQEGCKETFYM